MRPETTFIQLWYACGAFKKWGYALENKGGPMFRNTSYAVASSESIIPQYSLAFNLPENRVLPLGVPRTDRFFRADYCEVSRNVLEKEFPSARGKKVILFAPTFRGDKLHSAEYKIELDLDLMYTMLDGEYVLVCKMHPAVSTPHIADKYRDFVHVCASETDINELMGAADILVTDYSSIIFEYSLINRPMLFYAPDYKEYATGRGFFYDYEEFIPGEMVMNTQQLVAAIKNQGYDMDRIQAFRQKFMSACDGQASKRIVKELFE
jgi:CDP-ribitol ribitolphosphotransferase